MANPLPPVSRSQAVEQRLSVERLGAYRAAVGGDLDRAVALYEWNTTIAAAFFEILGHCEVVLRNALHEQLDRWHAAAGRPGSWYDDPAGVLDPRRHDEITLARDRLRRAGKAETPGRVVAELNFGFWRFLLDRHYQNVLWAPALRRAFPNLTPANRRTVYQPIVDLNEFRNRIAHHEPIHQLNLAQRHQDVLDVIGYIDPDVAAWIATLTRVPALLASRPR